MLTHVLVAALIVTYATLFVVGWYAGYLQRRLLASILGRVTGVSPRNKEAQLRAPGRLITVARVFYPIIAPVAGAFWLTHRSRRSRRELLVRIINAGLPFVAQASMMTTKDARRVSIYLGKWLVLWALRDAEAESQDSPVTCGRCGAKLPLSMWGRDHDCDKQ